MFEFPQLLVSLLALFLAVPVFGQEGTLTDEQLASIQLPMDPDDPVFEYDSFGGMRMAVPKDYEATPSLRIFSDGKVVTGGRSPKVKNCIKMLSENELNQFLYYVANKNEFYEIKTAELKNKMADTGKELFIADAPTARFSINLQRGTNSVEIYALQFASRTFTNIDELHRLLGIQKKCQKLIAMSHLGGEQQAAKLLEQINKQLHASQPGLAGFVEDDIRFATRFTNGKFQASFQKSYEATGQSPGQVITARIIQATTDSDPEVKISIK